MAIVGLELDRTNPDFRLSDFLAWMPQFTKYVATTEGEARFNKLRELANNKIFSSIYGSDWELAMCYCIAHYLTLISEQSKAPSGETLASISGGGIHKGIVSSASVGSFNKSIDFSHTMLTNEESFFWNQTSYGSQLYALFVSKGVPTIFVVTGNIHR